MTSFNRAAVVATVAVLAAAASATESGKITLGTSCQDDCSACTTEVSISFTNGTSYCTGAYSAFECDTAAYKCVGVTSYSDGACATETSVANLVCGVCNVLTASTSNKVTCSSGSTDASVAVYTTADCSGDAALTSTGSSTCAADTSGSGSNKVTVAGYGCNAFATKVYTTAACTNDASTEIYLAQNVCFGGTTGSNDGVKISCPDNADASSASVFSAAAAALVAVLCVVA